MEILHVFGVDWRLLTIQIVNFGVLMFLLWLFLYTPLMRLLDERRAKIEKGVKDADAAAHSLARAEEERRETMAQAAKDADASLERARRSIEEKERVAVDEAAAKADRIVKAAETASEEMKSRALKEAEKDMARLIVLGAEKAIMDGSVKK